MIFRKRLKNPQTAFVLGMLCVLLFNLMSLFQRLVFNPGEAWMDGLRGLFLGMALSLIFLGARLKGIRRGDGGGADSSAGRC